MTIILDFKKKTEVALRREIKRKVGHGNKKSVGENI